MVLKKNVLRGKKARASGARFELKVRKDLESKGWIVSKWMNNVSEEKLIPAKHKFRGKGIPMAMGTGFPDFIAFRFRCSKLDTKEMKIANDCHKYEIIGVECKSRKYLDYEEKQKCKWLLENKIFSKILIASKGKKRGSIEYNEFKY